MPLTQEAPAVRAIHRVRTLSRECHDLQAREVLIRVERRMIALLSDVPTAVQ